MYNELPFALILCKLFFSDFIYWYELSRIQRVYGELLRNWNFNVVCSMKVESIINFECFCRSNYWRKQIKLAHWMLINHSCVCSEKLGGTPCLLLLFLWVTSDVTYQVLICWWCVRIFFYFFITYVYKYIFYLR